MSVVALKVYRWNRSGEYAKYQHMTDKQVKDIANDRTINDYERSVATDELINRHIADNLKQYGFHNVMVINDRNKEFLET